MLSDFSFPFSTFFASISTFNFCQNWGQEAEKGKDTLYKDL